MRKNKRTPKRNLVGEVAVITAVSSPEEIGQLKVAHICEILQCSRSTLNRHFKAEMKCTLEDFLLRQKITKACFFIESDLANKYLIKDIGRIFGFPKTSTFISTFKKYMLTTPDKYRKCKEVLIMTSVAGEEQSPFFIYTARISLLLSVENYKLDNAFIVNENGLYRLIVYNIKKNVLFDSTYKQIFSAHRAFRRILDNMYKPDEIFTANWSPFSFPLKSWWADRLIEIEAIKSKGKGNDGSQRQRYQKIA